MSLTIKQDFEYKGSDWWMWSVWIDGPEVELDDLDHVEYTLHPTFPKPVRVVNDRDSKFRLSAAGWGVFTIYVKAMHKNGQATRLEHELELLYDDGEPTTA
jgi:transcription initiation factor IIF auxiliary subunit